MELSQGGHDIRTVEEWLKYAGPRFGLSQWRDGYSAKELAKAWCSGGVVSVPAEFQDLLNRIVGFSRVRPLTGHPEQRVRFDGLPGEPRNADLVLNCSSQQGTVAVSVEAKVRETFGEYIHKVITDAAQKWAEEKPSNQLVRLQTLYSALFSRRTEGAPAFGELRYQLLTAAAGALVYAGEIHANAAVLVVHEFRPTNAQERRFADNARDFVAFAHRMTGQAPGPGQDIVGPIAVPGGDRIPAGVPLFLAKITTACDPAEHPTRPQRPAV